MSDKLSLVGDKMVDRIASFIINLFTKNKEKKESEEKEAVLETKKFKDQIVARNVLIYVLPLIAIGITAFLIWKRKK
jgi:FMN-dependent NADH-azoreductase